MDAQKTRLRRFALFSILAFLDDRLAAEISEKATLLFKARNPKVASPKTGDDEIETPEMRREMIWICFSQWQTHKKRMAKAHNRGLTRGQPEVNLANFGQLPPKVELGPWLRFHTDASEEEMLAVLFTQVLQFSEAETAEALKISLGTLRHRVGKGIRVLGDYVGPTL